MKWKKPEIKTVKFDELARIISARARSLNDPIPDPPPSCNGCGGCSCAAQCNPLALFWSCALIFVAGISEKNNSSN